MATYVAAKARLVEFQEPADVAVLNGRDRYCRAMGESARGRVVWFDEFAPDPPMPVPGEHNLMNARAAAAIGRAAGLDDERIFRAVAAFQGVEHRLELVGEWGGVRWYNDSKATNPDAGLVAVNSFPGVPLVLIAGGHGSGFELDDWVRAVRERTIAVVLIGESAELLAELLAGHRTRRAGDLEEAIALAAEEATAGGAVLLSPAYKSFDMFSGYEERGRRFKEAVRRRHEGAA
jgi:UDP-N-acetylmuramoylalanine--D-glutamate ligase